MHKDFDRWNKTKKKLNAEAEPLYFREGETWWVHLGVNIGYEIDGKKENFARPVIVLRKYNKYSFLALPLTTSARANPWKLFVGAVGGKQAFAVLSPSCATSTAVASIRRSVGSHRSRWTSSGRKHCAPISAGYKNISPRFREGEPEAISARIIHPAP
jgi:hypothetical protein